MPKGDYLNKDRSNGSAKAAAHQFISLMRRVIQPYFPELNFISPA
jgi:hypothetical protein